MNTKFNEVLELIDSLPIEEQEEILNIEKKRLIENVASSSDKGPKKRKYIKQADLERIKEQEYLAKQAELERKREVYYFFKKFFFQMS